MSASGIFSNGRTTGRTEVELRLATGRLEIRDRRDNLMLAQWAFADLAPIRPLKPGKQIRKLRLVCQKDPDARLEIEDPTLISELQKNNRALRPPRKPLPRWVWPAAAGTAVIVILWLLLVCLAAAAGPLSRNIPLAWEIAVGQRLADNLIDRLGGTCRGMGGQAALDVLAQRFDHDATRGQPLRLRAVKMSVVNAFALPGYTIIVTSGMINDVETADQLAVVVAHQLAHLDLRHNTEQVIRRSGIGMALFAADADFPFTNTALADLQRMPHDSREEAEANILTVTLLQKADISVAALASFLRIQDLHQRTRGFPSAFQTAHSTVVKREEPQGDQPFARPTLNDREWQSLRNICG